MALLGVELAGEDVVASDGDAEGAAVVGGRVDYRGVFRDAVVAVD
jgi:hypothetical protein